MGDDNLRKPVAPVAARQPAWLGWGEQYNVLNSPRCLSQSVFTGCSVFKNTFFRCLFLESDGNWERVESMSEWFLILAFFCPDPGSSSSNPEDWCYRAR